MELFDVVDKNRNKLGYTKIRGEKLEDKEYNTGVEIWIINDNKLSSINLLEFNELVEKKTTDSEGESLTTRIRSLFEPKKREEN